VSGTLYLVGTPIGNMEDLTDRARATLARVDVVAAEDTRRTGLLLRRIGARPRLISFFEANEGQRVPEILRLLQGGEEVALVSDAGMPTVSDPGYRLVTACVESGLAVDVVPGPSAGLAALAISGLPTDRFVFEGFLPRTGRARTERLADLAEQPRTAVLFESPRRVAGTLRDLLATCGDRRAAVARELTKMHQEVLRGKLSELSLALDSRQLKGEVVLVLEGRIAPPPDGDSVDEAFRIARGLIAEGAKKRPAAREAAARTGVPAAEIYAALVDG
jgi:16S rRNA (cytidine1402-2'-O)-methyltransferase